MCGSTPFDPLRRQVPLELGNRLESHRFHSRAFGRLYIRWYIVCEEAFIGWATGAVQGNLVDGRVGLGGADLEGQHAIVEVPQGWVGAAHGLEGEGGCIRESEQAIALVQAGQESVRHDFTGQEDAVPQLAKPLIADVEPEGFGEAADEIPRRHLAGFEPGHDAGGASQARDLGWRVRAVGLQGRVAALDIERNHDVSEIENDGFDGQGNPQAYCPASGAESGSANRGPPRSRAAKPGCEAERQVEREGEREAWARSPAFGVKSHSALGHKSIRL